MSFAQPTYNAAELASHHRPGGITCQTSPWKVGSVIQKLSQVARPRCTTCYWCILLWVIIEPKFICPILIKVISVAAAVCKL